MALIGKRRVPVRIPKAEWGRTMNEATEWWVVEAPSAVHARRLCLNWPMIVKDGPSQIMDHGKLRK